MVHQVTLRLVLMLDFFLIGNLPPEKACLIGMQSRPVAEGESVSLKYFV